MSETHAHEIIPRLWIGDRIAASDPEFLKRNNITAVFNATKDLPFLDSVPRKYRIPVQDNLEEEEITNMQKWAPEIIYKLIREYKEGNCILVHCYAGRQRSAAIMTMSLMVLLKKTADEAMRFLREKRPVAFFPFANFQEAIHGFEKKLREALGKT
jgi:protein-tyrosine phosphatase